MVHMLNHIQFIIFQKSGSFDTASINIIGLENGAYLAEYYAGFAADTSITNAIGLRSNIGRQYVSGQPSGQGKILTSSAIVANLDINSPPGMIDNYIAFYSDLSGKSSIATKQYHLYLTGSQPSYIDGD